MTEAPGCFLLGEASPLTPITPFPAPQKLVKVKTEPLEMAETPNLTQTLADIQRNLAIMQERADQADASTANLRALIEERLPLVAAAGGGGGREDRGPATEENLQGKTPAPNPEIAALIAKMAKLEETVSKVKR